MNNVRHIATRLPKLNIMNNIQKRNVGKCPPPTPKPQETSCTEKIKEAHPKNVHVIFGPDSQTAEKPKNKTYVDKLQEKIRNKPECVTKPPLEPEVVIEVIEVPPEKPVCVQKKPPVPSECVASHICGNLERRDIFKQVVNESIFKERKTKCLPVPQSTKPVQVRPTSSSTLSRIEHTLSKMLATAIVGFIAYWTWLYGNFGGNENGQGTQKVPSSVSKNENKDNKVPSSDPNHEKKDDEQ